MNTDYSQTVKEIRDNFDANHLLSTPTLTDEEVQLANGRQYLPAVYFLFVANAMIFAVRRNYGNCPRFALGSLIVYYPLAHYTWKYLFGYEKLRQIHKRQLDSAMSAKLYEREVLRTQHWISWIHMKIIEWNYSEL